MNNMLVSYNKNAAKSAYKSLPKNIVFDSIRTIFTQVKNVCSGD